jgi:hypothetical protein
MNWCCVGFKSAYDGAGRRGFAILVEPDATLGPRFIWQHRALEMGDENKLAALKLEFPLSVVTDTGLLFCPWCGKNLRTFYGRHAAELSRPGLEIPLE